MLSRYIAIALIFTILIGASGHHGEINIEHGNIPSFSVTDKKFGGTVNVTFYMIGEFIDHDNDNFPDANEIVPKHRFLSGYLSWSRRSGTKILDNNTVEYVVYMGKGRAKHAPILKELPNITVTHYYLQKQGYFKGILVSNNSLVYEINISDFSWKEKDSKFFISFMFNSDLSNIELKANNDYTEISTDSGIRLYFYYNLTTIEDGEHTKPKISTSGNNIIYLTYQAFSEYLHQLLLIKFKVLEEATTFSQSELIYAPITILLGVLFIGTVVVSFVRRKLNI